MSAAIAGLEPDEIDPWEGPLICIKVWGNILPDKYGGDQEFYSALSSHYEDEEYLQDQEIGEGEDDYDDGSIQEGIDKALDFLERHEEDNK